MAALDLAVAAFIINLPLGMWRRAVPKFSWRWYLAVHLSVPVLVYLRYRLGLPAAYIPLTLAAAVCGQFAGGRLLSPPGPVGDPGAASRDSG